MSIRTRFSPSPTGMIHIGNARAALYSALYAQKQEGTFILRIEDTDATRSGEQYTEALQKDLQWLGINWQEGPGVGGGHGPYWQSQRQDIYAHYYAVLEQKGQIYPCFCTDNELALARKVQLSRGLAPRYAGTCKKLSKEEVAARIAEGKTHAWRFAVPPDITIEFTDVVKGPQYFQSNDIGDFIVRRADGTAPFLFCNAIDDAKMQVSNVLRGEDHLANTPRQILILNALALSVPSYGHLSLIVGDDGTPLSKRHGSFSVHEMHAQGYLPIAIINYLSRLGHVIEINELLDFDHLAMQFYLEKLSRSPARFDVIQLMYWQKLAVQALSAEAFWHWLGDNISAQIPEASKTLFAEAVKANVEFPQDAANWARIFFHDHVMIDDAEQKYICEAGEQFFVEAEQAVDKHGIELPLILADIKQSLNVSGKKLFMPLRIALTGKMHGPEIAHIAQLLGPKKIKQRLSDAFKIASGK